MAGSEQAINLTFYTHHLQRIAYSSSQNFSLRSHGLVSHPLLSSELYMAMAGRDFTGQQVGYYFLSSVLGSGASGSVYRGVDVTLHASPTYAIKCIPKSSNPNRRGQQAAEIFNHDAVVLCPHVLTLCDFFEERDCIFLVLPLCEMDMERAIFSKQIYRRNNALIKKTFVEILDGVFACHKKGVFHRDLKPENIMCNADGTKIQIGDFGLSTNRRICRDGGCGTIPYMSPECLNKDALGYDASQADIWSLGVILFNMVTARFPWEEAMETDKGYMEFLTTRDNFLRMSSISEGLNALLCRIWRPTPMKRMSIPAIRQAVLEMDTFYKQTHSSHAASALAKEVTLVDSEVTCVATDGDAKKASCAPAETLEQAMHRLELEILGLVE